MSYEECYCGHRRIEWPWRPSCTCPGSCGLHCLCHHARTTGPNVPQVKEVKDNVATHSVDLHSIELDVLSEESTD